MNKIIILSLILITSSCVTQQAYDELEAKYYSVLQDNVVFKEKANLYTQLLKEREKLEQERDQLQIEYDKVSTQYENALNNYNSLKEDYTSLQNTNKEALTASSKKNIETIQKLEEAQANLLNKEAALEETQNALQGKIDRINELENALSSQKEKLSLLKNSLLTDLKSFENEGLHIEEREGRIYVSMENKLLFDSGSWNVSAQGKNALRKISEVLKKDNSLHILVEGHTDTAVFNGKFGVTDNWDLSVKRATSITKILQDNGVSPVRMTAAGRGEFSPIADNATAEGKAKNRRVEIILTPDLSEINQILEQIY